MTKVKYIISLFILCTVFYSCGINEVVEQVKVISTDLENHFKHEPIDIRISYKLEKEFNKVQITFLNYNLETSDKSQLKSLADMVEARLKSKFPDFVKAKRINVRFTAAKKIDDNTIFEGFWYKFSE